MTFPRFDSLFSQADLDKSETANPTMHPATMAKLDRLEKVVRRHLARSGPVSIPEIGRILGLSRQGVSYQLDLLAKTRGLVIPPERRYPQSRPCKHERPPYFDLDYARETLEDS